MVDLIQITNIAKSGYRIATTNNEIRKTKGAGHVKVRAKVKVILYQMNRDEEIDR